MGAGGRTVVGVALAYRLLHFKSFTDSSGASREGGVAQFLGLDFVLTALMFGELS